MQVRQIPTAKNICHLQNKPFNEIRRLFEIQKKAINISRLLIIILLVSNLMSWIYVASLTKAFIEHDHSVNLESVPQLPLVEELE